MTRPNILFLLSDDQGAWALGCAGNREIETPHLDALAASGCRWENFFCTSPVCSPARASLLTGRIPSAHGVHDWIRGGNGADGGPPIDYIEGMPTYVDELARAGYDCAMVGKWHLGDSLRRRPAYSHWFVCPFGGSPYLDAMMIRNGAQARTRGYLTDVIADDAISFLENKGDDSAPFYLSVHFTAPHSPHLDQHPEDLVEKYRECPFDSIPLEPKHPWMPNRVADLEFSRTHSRRGPGAAIPIGEYQAGYYAAVTAMDRAIGRLLAVLRERGLEENTLVVFLSDNGFACGQRGIWGKGNVTSPLNLYDVNVKVPAIFRWPGTLPGGRVVTRLGSGYDIFPTILEAAGHSPPASDIPLPGASLLPIMRTEGPDLDPASIVVFDEYGPARMLRDSEWKYVHRYPYGPNELYDLVEDPGERVNLLDDYRDFRLSSAEVAAKADSLKQRLDQWFSRFALPEYDGRAHAVTGRGQIGKVGSSAGTGNPFAAAGS